MRPHARVCVCVQRFVQGQFSQRRFLSSLIFKAPVLGTNRENKVGGFQCSIGKLATNSLIFSIEPYFRPQFSLVSSSPKLLLSFHSFVFSLYICFILIVTKWLSLKAFRFPSCGCGNIMVATPCQHSILSAFFNHVSDPVSQCFKFKFLGKKSN